jgi:hypothetical protein
MGFQTRILELKPGLLITALLLAALAVEIGFLLVLPSRYRVNESADYWNHYAPTAENIVNGNGIVGADGKIELVYPPGYPLLLATAFRIADLINLNRDTLTEALSVLAGATSSVLLFLIVRLFFGYGIGLLSWVLWITYLPNLWTLKEPMSEVPFMLFLYAAIWLFSWGLHAQLTLTGLFTGFLLGEAALVRPIGLFLPLVFAFAIFACRSIHLRKRGTVVVLLVIGFAASITPWELYVLQKTNRLIVLCTNGPSSLSGGLVFGVTGDPTEPQIWLPDHLREFMDSANSERRGMVTEGDIARFVGQEAIRNPVGFGQLLLVKLYRPWYATESRRHEGPVLLLQLGYLAFALAGLASSLMASEGRRFWILFLLGLVVYFWGMAFLVVPLLRYMVPAMAFLMPFAAIGISQLAMNLRGRAEAGARSLI